MCRALMRRQSPPAREAEQDVAAFEARDQLLDAA